MRHFTDQKPSNRLWSVKYTLFGKKVICCIGVIAIHHTHLLSKFQSIFRADIRAFPLWSVKYPRWHLKNCPNNFLDSPKAKYYKSVEKVHSSEKSNGNLFCPQLHSQVQSPFSGSTPKTALVTFFTPKECKIFKQQRLL